MRNFLAGYGRNFAHRIRVVTYDQWLATRQFQRQPAAPPGAYIFTGLGSAFGSRSPPSPARLWAASLCAQLTDANGPRRVLNHPTESLERYDLLRALHDSGVNHFNAHRASEANPAMRFPVQLRPEAGSMWRSPPLAATRAEYEAALRHAGDPAALLAIEYCDTADASGVYRKYGCFVIGECIVPRHVFFSRNWFIKVADLLDDAYLEEELDYVRRNPHRELMLNVCRMANIGYGRIDYGLLDGRPQIWEINTTPTIVRADESPLRKATTAAFAALYEQALDVLDPPVAL